MDSKVVLSNEEERLVHALQLLGDRTRFRMYKLLMSGREMCVSEIADTIGISVSAVSQHFRSFEMLGLVSRDRIGQKICYSLKPNDNLVNTLSDVLESSIKLIKDKEKTHA
jgi:DNA-binding transcriptional ArsR family regulator